MTGYSSLMSLGSSGIMVWLTDCLIETECRGGSKLVKNICFSSICYSFCLDTRMSISEFLMDADRVAGAIYSC